MPVLVGRAPGETALRLLAVDLPAKAGAPSGAFLFGQGDRTLLALAQQNEVRWSPGLRVAADGKVSRDFQRLDLVDGVALAQVPPELHPGAAVVTTVGQADQLVSLRPRLASAHPRELAGLLGSAGREDEVVPGTGTGIRPDGARPRRFIAAPTLRPPDEISTAGVVSLMHTDYLDSSCRRSECLGTAGRTARRPLALPQRGRRGRPDPALRRADDGRAEQDRAGDLRRPR